MSTAYVDTGRSAQKARTRDALVAAARELVATGVTPTLDQAAARASVSRTTAHRYFSSRHALLVAAHPETVTRSMLPVDPPHAPEARLDAVVTAFTQLVLDTESQQRTMLRLSLSEGEPGRTALPLRQGRAIAWIHEALEPVQDSLTEEQLHQLVLAIRSAVGIEALVWLTDIAGLSRKRAVELMRWTACALLQQALDGAVPPTR